MSPCCVLHTQPCLPPHSTGWERSGQCPHTLHLPQIGTNSVWEVPQTPSPCQELPEPGMTSSHPFSSFPGSSPLSLTASPLTHPHRQCTVTNPKSPANSALASSPNISIM